MNVMSTHITRIKDSAAVLVLMFLTITLCAGQSFAHAGSQQPISPQVGVKLLSAEMTRFDKPIRIGVGKRAIEYQEALVLKVLVDREKFDSLPPSMEPFLYIGRYEYRMFHIDRNDRRKELILTFHVRNWEELKDRAPIVLTIDHGGPIRDPERFMRPDTPRFSKGMREQAPTYTPSKKLVASDDVPDSVAQKARLLAEKHPPLLESLQKARVVYIGTELLRRKTEVGEEYPTKIYRVIHYRYDDDAAIHSEVSLVDAAVLDQREIPHLPTPLTQEELDTAIALAMKDRRVREALGKDVDRVEVEALVIRAASEEDPWFGRRVVQLLFRVGRDYRHSPRVIVDLTKSTVLVETEEDLK